MKRNHIVGSSIAALCVLAWSTNAWTTESEAKRVEYRPADRAAVVEADDRAVSREAKACDVFCEMGEMPVYVPPSRGSVAHRIGGGTRGGGFRT